MVVNEKRELQILTRDTERFSKNIFVLTMLHVFNAQYALF